jgi:hypothetical protein
MEHFDFFEEESSDKNMPRLSATVFLAKEMGKRLGQCEIL